MMNKVASHLLIYSVNCSYYTEYKVRKERYIHEDYKSRYYFAILVFVILCIKQTKKPNECVLSYSKDNPTK